MGKSIQVERSYYGRRLEELFRQKGYKPKEFAKIAGFSYQHLNHLLNGKRSFTLEILKKIAEVLGLSIGEIASLMLNEKPYISDGHKIVNAFLAHSSEERSGGKILILKENMLKDKYPQYAAENFMEYAHKYVESYYEEQYAKLEQLQQKEQDIQNTLSLNKKDNQYLRDIVELLYEVEPKELAYIKDSIELYVKHTKSKR